MTVELQQLEVYLMCTFDSYFDVHTYEYHAYEIPVDECASVHMYM